jgi:hypothetical protein
MDLLPGNHNAIAGGNDLVEILETLLVLDLWYDEDVLPLIAQHGAHLLHSSRVPDEGSENHVHVLQGNYIRYKCRASLSRVLFTE